MVESRYENQQEMDCKPGEVGYVENTSNSFLVCVLYVSDEQIGKYIIRKYKQLGMLSDMKRENWNLHRQSWIMKEYGEIDLD